MLNRRSHNRLLVAIGLSTVIVAALIAFLSTLSLDPICSDGSCFPESSILTVNLRPPKSEAVSPPAEPVRELAPVPATPQEEMVGEGSDDGLDNERGPRHDEEASSPEESPPARDWQRLAKTVAQQTVAERFRQNEVAKSMLRKTGSIMFRDSGEFDFQEPATIIARREFKVPVGVLGIGVTIGGCFFGIPLAGIPVERRSVGPNVIYCTDAYQ